MELFSRSGSKYGCELVEAYLFGKNSDEYSVAFRSFAKKGGHPKIYEEMVGLCEFRGFVVIITTISNNANVHTAYVANEEIIFKSGKRGGSCCG